MRTTVDINDGLLQAARHRAAEEGTSVKAVIETALRKHLGGTVEPTGFRLRWRSEAGRLQPGADLENRDTLFDLMDGRR